MMKERIGAIFIGLIMLSSVIGFALMGVVSDQSSETPEIPTIITGEIESNELLFFLQNGRTFFKYYYADDQKSLDDKLTLEIFVNKMKEYSVLNEIEANETSLEIIGSGGKITQFEEEINNQNLLTTFCEVAIIKPKDCFLYNI